jgi:putative salt-induced outer membrane protein YdiY
MKFGRSVFIGTALVLISATVAVAQPANKSNGFASKGLEGAPKKEVPVSCDAPPKDPAVWDKFITAGYNYTDGNSKTASLNLNGKVMRDYDGEAWRFEADYNYGNAAADVNSSREVTKQNARAMGDYKHTLDSVFFAGANASYAWDEIANLDYRVILSPNMGAYLLKNDVTALSLEAGPSYVWEKLGREDDNFVAARIADRFVWNISESALFYQSAEYLVAFDDSADYIVNAEIGIEAPLSSMVNLVLSVRDYYVNQPAEGRERNDVYTITGLKVNL